MLRILALGKKPSRVLIQAAAFCCVSIAICAAALEMGTADRSGLADRIHGWLEITHDIAGMKVFAPAFVATMILVTLDQLLFDGRFTEPVFTALSYVGGVIVDRI